MKINEKFQSGDTMKKHKALRILISILLANIVVFGGSYYYSNIWNPSPVNSADPLQTFLMQSMTLLFVLNVSILLAFLIQRKARNKLKNPILIFLMTLGIFGLEVFLLLRNIAQFSTSQGLFGLSSFATAILLFVLFNLSAVFVIQRYRKRVSEE
jgi:hypothetical protein